MSTNPVYFFFNTTPSFGPLFLRLVLVAVFFYQGAQKVFGWFGGEGWHQTIESWGGAYGPSVSAALIIAVMVAELFIAVTLFFGLLTRLAAFLGILIMGGELYYVSGGTSFDAVQLPLVILAACLTLLFMGGGHLSLDRAIGTNLLPYVG